jgi:beta-aspartyl-peptidase (threonine type)
LFSGVSGASILPVANVRARAVEPVPGRHRAFRPALAKAQGYRHYQIGTLTSATPDPVSGGLLLMGGGDRNHDAMHWFFAKAGHGHIVILRASQAGQVGKEFYKDIGGIQSAETFVFTDRAASSDPRCLPR